MYAIRNIVFINRNINARERLVLKKKLKLYIIHNFQLQNKFGLKLQFHIICKWYQMTDC